MSMLMGELLGCLYTGYLAKAQRYTAAEGDATPMNAQFFYSMTPFFRRAAIGEEKVRTYKEDHKIFTGGCRSVSYHFKKF